MKIIRSHPVRTAALACVAWIAATTSASAQTTNWAAYNDHRAGKPVPPNIPNPDNWGTSPRATIYDMGAPADLPASLLTDFRTGLPLAATVAFARTGSPDDFGGVGRPIPTNTPMARIFLGICDLATNGVIGVRTTPLNATESYVTMTFGGLNPAKRYVFRGAGVRNGSYARRWTVATISANDSVDAHVNGNGGPGVLTIDNFPSAGTNLVAHQAAWNSGHNAEGAVIGWDFVSPFPDGTFTITCKQYVGPIPIGGNAGTPNDLYGYAFGAFLLAEVEAVAPAITSNPVASTTVEQNRPFSLSVAATGTPLQYQWYKKGTPDVAIAGAIFPTYSVSQAAFPGDSGDYYAVVYNPLRRATSTVAHVTVFQDSTAPAVGTIFSYPTVDSSGNATLNQIIIEFNEPVTPASVNKPISYTVPGGGNPASVIVSNSSTVVLVLSSPLTPDTDYSVGIAAGATDMVGNVAGAITAPFHSWVSGIGNGLLFQAYQTPNDAASVEVDSLLESPNFPDNPFARATLGVFDSLAAFPNDTYDQYGGRISGVFIPPVSGTWLFYLRTRQRGVVYLNPNGVDPAGKVEILRESTGNTPLNWNRFTSPPQNLRAGQGYYIEALYKEGDGGDDFIKVAARLQGFGSPEPNDADLTMVDPSALAGAFVAFPLAPRNLGGTLTIVQDVADVTIDENNPATFSIQVSNPSQLPLQYQWFRDGSPISGANGPTYEIEPTIAADNGAMFSVQVAKVGNVVTSRAARLTVRSDTHGPQVIEVFSSYTTLTNVTVRFNERVNVADATDPFAFDPDGLLGVLTATLRPDGRTVDLYVAPLTLQQTYQMVVSIKDLVDNYISPNPTTINFVAGGSDLPRLTITTSPDYADISWPSPSTGFVLEETSQLMIPVSSTVWTAVSEPTTLINGRITVSVLTVGGGNKFYRLQQPPTP